MIFKFINFINIFIICVILFITLINCKSNELTLPDKLKCVDLKCSGIISMAKSTSNHNPIDNNFLSFRVNQNVRVYGKSNNPGKANNIWLVHIAGRVGYASSRLLKEYSIIVNNEKLIEVLVSDIRSQSNQNNAEEEQITLKSSELLNTEIEIEKEETTTTLPLKIDEEHSQEIRTDKIDTNLSTEIPNSSPVQNITDPPLNNLNGTSLNINQKQQHENVIIKSPEVNDDTEDDDITLDDEDDEEEADNDEEEDNESDEVNSNNSEEQQEISNESSELNVNNKENLSIEASNEDQTNSSLNSEEHKSDVRMSNNNETDNSQINTNNSTFVSSNTSDIFPNQTYTDTNNSNITNNVNVPVNETIPPPKNAYLVGGSNTVDNIQINNNLISTTDLNTEKITENISKTAALSNLENNSTLDTQKVLNENILITNELKRNDENVKETLSPTIENKDKYVEHSILSGQTVEVNKATVSADTVNNESNVPNKIIKEPSKVNENSDSVNLQNAQEANVGNNKESNDPKDAEKHNPTKETNDKEPRDLYDNSTSVNIQNAQEANVGNNKESNVPKDAEQNNPTKEPTDLNDISTSVNIQNAQDGNVGNNKELNDPKDAEKHIPTKETNAKEPNNLDENLASVSTENEQEANVGNIKESNVVKDAEKHNPTKEVNVIDPAKQSIPYVDEATEGTTTSSQKIKATISNVPETANQQENEQPELSNLNTINSSPNTAENSQITEQNTHEHQHRHPGLANLLQNHDHNHHDDHHMHQPEPKIEREAETTTPSVDNSQFYDPYLETTTANPKLQNNDPLSIVTPEINIKDENNNPNTPQVPPIFHEQQHIQQPPPSLGEEKGLFSTILGTVNSFWSSSSKQQEETIDNNNDELQKILYPNSKPKVLLSNSLIVEEGYCENIGPNVCPSKSNRLDNTKHHHQNTENIKHQITTTTTKCSSEFDFFTSISDKILEMLDIVVFLGIAGASSILFAFGYYCISNNHKENTLISKLNVTERSLMASNKEVAIFKHELNETKLKLSSIEDNSFGSNEMVVTLKQEIENVQSEKLKLQEQIGVLEKELENAAEAGLELNKIVSELLSSQSGDETIASSVEELQKQLNEQQNTIMEINTILGEKSRENSELNIFIAEQTSNFQKVQQDLKNQLELAEKSKIDTNQQFQDYQKQLQDEYQQKFNDLELIQNDFNILKPKYEDILKKFQISGARVEVLEDCLKNTKRDSNVSLKEVMDVANLKTEILALKREKDSYKEKFEGEMDARKLLDDHVKIISEEVANLKMEYIQSEKDKLEAQTRLEVLSTYFKDKETQLQKELSIKEAMWMKQQGETTSTVERVRDMQEEIQALKSQNDSLRAEIEAQAATHKALITSVENRAHEIWLTSRQSERKYEEARIEAAGLRRKLTTLAVVNSGINDIAPNNNKTDILPNNQNNGLSPIHLDSSTSPSLLNCLPPPPQFLPPPFMAPPPPLPHPHHFMGMQPPFMPPGEMRPPPLGRLMSPPPLPPANIHNRYSPSILNDEEDDDDDDYEYRYRQHRRYSPDNDSRVYSPDNHRSRYSPGPDYNRYNYGNDIISTYDTETDFSPPPSPRNLRGGSRSRDEHLSSANESRSERRSGGNGGYKKYSPQPQSNNSSTKSIVTNSSDLRNPSKTNKGGLNTDINDTTHVDVVVDYDW